VLHAALRALFLIMAVVESEADKTQLGELSDEALFAAVALVEADLAAAKAALAVKSTSDALPKTAGPCTMFEGTPIDCGAMADAVVATYLHSIPTPELETMTAETQAKLAAATAALEAKRAAPATAPTTEAKRAAPATAPTTSSPSQSAKDRSSSYTELLAEKLSPVVSKSMEKLSPVVSKSMEVLDGVSEKTGVPKSGIAAFAAAAVGVGVAVVAAIAGKSR